MIDAADNFRLADWPLAILAGGMGTRLRPITEQIPKALVTVAGEAFLAHQLRLLERAGVRRVIMCVGYRGEMIESQFGDGERFGIELSYSYDGPKFLGTGGAIRKALDSLGQHFLVLYGDSYLPIDYAAPAKAFRASGKLGLMTVFRNEGRWDKSNVCFEDDGIMRYDKKEVLPEMKHIDYGLGLFHSEAFSAWRRDEAFDLADVYRDLVANGQLAGYEVTQRFYEIGSPAGLAELDSFLRSHEVSPDP
ncbi:MAG TPA: nucleotidyltransferase family protein [Chthoniobacterales bacterium]|nr:nucleotidyltransferase family protein [Chthoniobacterales bacterium]